MQDPQRLAAFGGEFGVAANDQTSVITGRCNQIAMRTQDIGEDVVGKPGLLEAKRVTPAAQFQISLGDQEPVASAPQNVEALLRGLRQGRIVEENTGALLATSPDPPAQLVQLGQAETFGLLDDHDGGVGYIDTHLDDGRGDQHR